MTQGLFVETTGQGPPLLFGHSLTLDRQMWSAQVAALSDRFTCHCVDLHGHGRSADLPGPYSLDGMADDLARTLDRLDVAQVGYCGLSMGGMVGMRFALRHPDRVASIVLMNTTAEPEEPTRRRFFAKINEATRGKAPDHKTVTMVVGLMLSPAFRSTEPERAQWIWDKLNVPNSDGTYHAANAIFERGDIRADLEALDVPAVVVTSDVDLAIPTAFTQRLAAAIPGARLVTYQGSGHLTAVERADEVNDLLRAFFTEHPPSTSA